MPGVEARRLLITGIVQGVGFRPFVYQTARELGLAGWVLNGIDGVRVHVEGAPDALGAFEASMKERHPLAARVDAVDIESKVPEGFRGFEIRESTSDGRPTTRLSPDLCVCDDCLREITDPTERRFGYAYTYCTNCGPRYSIIRSLPYDRPRTTMADWPMCDECQREYDDPLDRRFHAQPTACPACGPQYRLELKGEVTATGSRAVEAAAQLLAEGAILAIKGLGGYHLACDASNAIVIGELRERKFRKEKPFAVMARDLSAAEALADLSAQHKELLTSTPRPIVLAPVRQQLLGVHPGVSEVGLMLPYTPLHHLLFAAGAPSPLVLTSANRSSEPIAYRDDHARESLAGIADGLLVGDRPIQRRVDDSVVAIRSGRPTVIRRARGYAPSSVATIPSRRPILALGADLKNAVALAIDEQVLLSQHIGDLGDVETDRAFRETIDDLLEMYEVDRSQLVIAHDLHPQFVSTRLAAQLDCAQCIAVQHHEAHIASTMIEYESLDTTVVGIALDGTGYGHDGTIWGGEIFVGSISKGFERVNGLAPVVMPGGDAAAKHPVQAAAAYIGARNETVMETEPFCFPDRFRLARRMIARGTRCIQSTSAGRLFDAIAAVCGFTRPTTYEGQAAIWLEQLAREHGSPSSCAPTSAPLDAAAYVTRAIAQRLRGATPAHVASRFHAEFAADLAAIATNHARDASVATLALGGGVWQNARLLGLFLDALPPDMEARISRDVPCNDGGISVGQIALAHARTNQ